MSALRIAFRVLASDRTTALLVIILSLAIGVSAFVPQAADAVELSRDQSAETMHLLFALGLTDIFDSAWLHALGALLAGNVLAIFVRKRHEGRAQLLAEPPESALVAEIELSRPESAVEVARDTLSVRVGPPRLEVAIGPKASLVFDSGAGVSTAPLLTHLGLLVAVLAAGLEVSSVNPKDLAAGAVLLVTDRATGATGRFDMVQGESVEFFHYPARYMVRDYVISHENLGPALRLERVSNGQTQGAPFWVFKKAPAGFDARHRAGEVAIEAVSMGLRPIPGKGMSRKLTGALLLFGLAMVAVGAMRGQGASGRLWVVTEGAKMRLIGQPDVPGDRDFEARFERWSEVTKEALVES